VATLFNNPETELKDFLAPLPVHLQKSLLHHPMSVQETIDSVDTAMQEAELRPKLESILRRIPGEWKQYVKRARRGADVLSRLIVPKGKPGRSKKTALAEEAASLHRAGMNNPQIAGELNRRHGQGTTTPEAVRKLLLRHPDKT
jgi:DNA-binding NarL/FixJ family response regulator